MPQKWDGIISQYLNRRASRPIANFLASHTRVTPNQITATSFGFGILSALLFFPYGIVVLGGVFAQISSILDGVDGDLAKLSNRVTTWGGFLDSILDRYADVIILSGMGAYGYIFEEYPLALLCTIGAIVGSVMVSYTRALSDKILGFSFRSPISSYLANRDVRLFIVFVGSILSFILAPLALPVISYVLVLIALITNASVFRRIIEVEYWRQPGQVAQ